MTGPRRTHPYPCPTCGRTIHATAAYQVRHNRPCLRCTRAVNGWRHQPACDAPDDHRGACGTPAAQAATDGPTAALTVADTPTAGTYAGARIVVTQATADHLHSLAADGRQDVVDRIVAGLIDSRRVPLTDHPTQPEETRP